MHTVQFTPVEFVSWQSGWRLERGRHGDWVEVPSVTRFVRAGSVASRPEDPVITRQPAAFVEGLDDDWLSDFD